MCKLTIVVAIYNVECYLNECLQSLKNQSYKKDYEILLINDGSTDNSKEICEKFIKNGLNAKIINKKNGGVSSVRNMGIEQAKGEYIFFIDGDDWIEKNTIEIIFDNLDNCDLLCFGFKWVSKNSTIDKRFLKDEYIYHNFVDYLFKDQINRSVWNKVFKKRILLENNIKFPELKIAEEYIFIYRYLVKCKYIKKLNLSLYNYRYREESLSNEKKEEYYISHLKSFNMIIELENKNKNNNFIKYLLEEYVYLIREYNKREKEKKEKIEEVKILRNKIESFLKLNKIIFLKNIKFKMKLRYIKLKFLNN